MRNPTQSESPTSSSRTYSPAAALLSYFVPGLGQIFQGRVAKGIVFMVSLYALFFYGMYLGNWCNVYLPDTAAQNNPWGLKPRPLANVYNRLQFAGQFWIGIAAWPALWQYNEMAVPSSEASPFWHNFQRTPPEDTNRADDAWRKWKDEGLNEMQSNGDKTWDLGWVFTVIAGVLNILVIYDAYAGPAMAAESEPRARTQEAAA